MLIEIEVDGIKFKVTKQHNGAHWVYDIEAENPPFAVRLCSVTELTDLHNTLKTFLTEVTDSGSEILSTVGELD